MTAPSSPPGPKSRFIQRWRHRLAFNLGVTQSRKIAIYEDLLDSVSLMDVSYWLQVLLSAGIATLGLVLNSPAVIIGAMLISPLMGPILANGMAFAVGDLILAARAILSLTLSCMVAVGFAIVLITVLPFKEQTPEITARIQPNLLDMVVALFSGALGAVATAKEPKGVVTSIPGVAIAVALMPPLCVVGFGIGRALSLRVGEGLTIAWGGGLLFVTNLTAITLMAMLVFTIIRVDVPSIKRRAEEWHEDDPESCWMRQIFEGLPGINRLEVIGSARNRLIVILLPIFVLMIPLGQAFGRLQTEFANKQRQTELSADVRKIWRQKFGDSNSDDPRAYIDNLEIRDQDNDVLQIQMRVFTREPFTNQEQEDLKTRYAVKFKDGESDLIDLRLVQIETSRQDVADNLAQRPPVVEQEIKSAAELQSELWQQLNSSLNPLDLPGQYQFLKYDFVLNSERELRVNVAYLGDVRFDSNAMEILDKNITRRLATSSSSVKFNFVSKNAGQLIFEDSETVLSEGSKQTLDRVGQLLNQYPLLRLQLSSQINQPEEPSIFELPDTRNITLTNLRVSAIRDYLKSFAEIPSSRIMIPQPQPSIVQDKPSAITLTLTLQEQSENIGGVGPSIPSILPNSNSIDDSTNIFNPSSIP